MAQVALLEAETRQQALALLKKHWGYDQFLPFQEEAIASILNQQDSLVILPTGGGKSLCYQLPALMMNGLVLVISPLISLMKDQVDTLCSLGISAGYLNSTLSEEERQSTLSELRAGHYKLLYVAPERLLKASNTSEGFLTQLEDQAIAYVVIDEAHCVSQWGHDFRPAYRALGNLRGQFENSHIHAYTATATPEVQDDIIRSLNLNTAQCLIGDFERSNLFYRVQYRQNLHQQVETILKRHTNEGGIIYCISRKEVDELAAHLKDQGYSALPYHAGLTSETRLRHQESFLNEKTDIIVATVAFGMGIDRSNIRFVIHTGMPKSIEHYQQEAGRAGRDRLKAECTLLYSGSDVAKWRRITGEPVSEYDEHALKKLYEMSHYCQRIICRHKFLVEYFGQPYPKDNCGHCDACLGEYDILPDSKLMARKILSGVARLRERFGATHVAQVLKGANTEKIRINGHCDLSTYGLLKDQPLNQITHWMEQLVDQGFLYREPEFGILQFTASGILLLKDEYDNEVILAQPIKTTTSKVRRSKSGATESASDWPGIDSALFEKLRILRKTMASEKKVPAYIIFGDATLREIAHVQPQKLDDFRGIKGVGETKLKEICPRFLDVIQAHLNQTV